jgi:hypothetical protein
MIAVSNELVSLRAEGRRMAMEQVARGSALPSQSLTSLAQELEAKAGVLQSQLDYLEAAAEMENAMGQAPGKGK